MYDYYVTIVLIYIYKLFQTKPIINLSLISALFFTNFLLNQK